MILLNQRGVFPILLLAAIGVAVVAGGAYAVKNNIVTSKNGQIIFNGFKNKGLSDAKAPSPESDSSKAASSSQKAELADKTVEYNPETGEPKFSITPPAGWVKEKGQGRVKLFFEASQEDKKEFGYSTSRSTANIQVTSEKSSAKNLDEVMTKYKKEAAAEPVKIEILKEQKTTFAGQEAIVFELIVGMADVSDAQIEAELKKSGNQSSVKDVQDMLKSGKVRGLGYIILKNGYEIGIAGTALGSAWDKRGPAIESSINSFKFLDNESTQKQSDPATQNNSLQTNKNTVPVFTIDNPDGWTNLLIPNAQTADYHSAEIDHPYDPNTHVRINIRKVYGSDLQQVVNRFKQNLPGSKVIQAQNLTINGLPGYLAEYKELGDDDYYQRHIYYFISFKDGFEINVEGRTFQRTWDKNGDTIKKAVQSFKLK